MKILKMEKTEFPLTKRFEDTKNAGSSIILKDELTIHNKSFRSGTIFNVIGWREIQEDPYLILSRGSWEGLINFNEIQEKIFTLKKDI